MNEKRFKSCVMPLHKTLYAYSFAILGDENDAADCLQEAMTKLWENRRRLDEISNLEAYATVTVKHIALSMASRRQRLASAFGDDLPDIVDSAPTPDALTEGREDIGRISQLLRRLPENQRKVVVMSAVGGLTNSEIKDATGLTDDNVRVLLSRGRKKLRQLFSL
ncbi:MAG: sigma-70 family RNA polymerase sigma factor [Muribaculaceae bacterium]